jgi:hypothetical protein
MTLQEGWNKKLAFNLKFTFPLGTQWKISSALSLEIKGYFERNKCFQKVHLKASIKLPAIRFIILCKAPTKSYKTEVNTIGRERKACGFFIL